MGIAAPAASVCRRMGAVPANARPSVTRGWTEDFDHLPRQYRVRQCRHTPAGKQKGAAEPSMIGTSGPSSSISTLSTPAPARAAIRCSIVPTRADPSPIVVQRLVSTTRSWVAGISRGPGQRAAKDERRGPAWAGSSVRLTRRPLCTPQFRRRGCGISTSVATRATTSYLRHRVGPSAPSISSVTPAIISS